MALSGSDKIRFFRAEPSAGPCATGQGGKLLRHRIVGELQSPIGSVAIKKAAHDEHLDDRRRIDRLVILGIHKRQGVGLLDQNASQIDLFDFAWRRTLADCFRRSDRSSSQHIVRIEVKFAGDVEPASVVMILLTLVRVHWQRGIEPKEFQATCGIGIGEGFGWRYGTDQIPF